MMGKRLIFVFFLAHFSRGFIIFINPAIGNIWKHRWKCSQQVSNIVYFPECLCHLSRVVEKVSDPRQALLSLLRGSRPISKHDNINWVFPVHFPQSSMFVFIKGLLHLLGVLLNLIRLNRTSLGKPVIFSFSRLTACTQRVYIRSPLALKRRTLFISCISTGSPVQYLLGTISQINCLGLTEDVWCWIFQISFIEFLLGLLCFFNVFKQRT